MVSNSLLETPTNETRSLPQMQRPPLARPGLMRELLNSMFFIVAALIAAEMALPRSSIDGPSMEPTLFAGQNLLISRVHYLFTEPQHGDIAVFDPPDEAEDMLIKRVIGLPGDTIEIRDQLVYRNGELLDEPYFVNSPCSTAMCPDRTWTLGDNEYFMMGDNRNRSNDSRRFGPIQRENLVGRAIFRYLPLDKFGLVH